MSDSHSDEPLEVLPSPSHRSRSSSAARSSTCPLCNLSVRDDYALWHHINLEHISRRCFPSLDFVRLHGRRVCSSCGFAYARRWNFCRRSQGSGLPRCGAAMIDPGTSAWFHVTPDTSDASCNTGSSIPEAVNQDTRCSSHHYGTDVVFQALKLAETLPSDSTNETVLFQALMNEIITLPVTTVVHIPRSVRPLLAQVLSSELSHARLHGIWGFARFHLFAKAVLRCPPRGGRKKRLVVKSILLTRLKRWQEGILLDCGKKQE